MSYKLLLFLCMMFFSSVTSATDGKYYISVKGGFAFIGNLSESQTVDSVVLNTGTRANKFTNKFTFDFNPGFNGGLELGLNLNPIRFGMEIMRSKASIKLISVFEKGDDSVLQDYTEDKNGDLKLLYFSTNIYYDFKIWERIVPYIGAGYSFDSTNIVFKIKNDSSNNELRQTKGSFQVMAGSQYFFKKRISIMIEYRLVRTGKFEYIEPAYSGVGFRNFKDNIINHSINTGIIFMFA